MIIYLVKNENGIMYCINQRVMIFEYDMLCAMTLSVEEY